MMDQVEQELYELRRRREHMEERMDTCKIAEKILDDYDSERECIENQLHWDLQVRKHLEY